MQKLIRIGQIVPSSNTTMETEIPAMLNAHAIAHATRFTYHSSRMRMKTVKSWKSANAVFDGIAASRKVTDGRNSIASHGTAASGSASTMPGL